MTEQVIRREIALAFDILLGMFTVECTTYNFIRPKAGDPAVFRTGSIDEFNRKLNMPVRPIGEDKYYIKRIVGEPGDTLKISVPESIYTNGTDVRKGVPGILQRNSKPIEGTKAFLFNNQRTQDLANNPNAKNETGYPGYRAEGLLTNKRELKIPKPQTVG